MHKVIGTLLIASLVIGLLIWSTPVARLGSGFLIGNARFVLTSYDVVKESENIQVKFPNENNIPAKPIYKDQTDNLTILKLQEPPKVKREPLFFKTENVALKDNYVFSLGYPWTNTLEDKHTLLEGSLVALNENATGLLKIDMEMEPIHSGGPLFNRNREVVGMVIAAETLQDRGNYSGKLNPAIPSAVLIDLMKKNNIPEDNKLATTLNNLTMDEFIEAVRNNVVLIEAR